MKPQLGALGWLAVTVLAGMALRAEERAYPCQRAVRSPAMDGRVVEDEAWRNIPGATGFYRLGGGYTEAKQTTAYATWDDEALYVAMVCEEPDVKEIKGERKDGDDLWLDNGIEVFVRPGDSPQVYQFIINTAGARRGAESATGNLDWQAAATKGEAAWTVEVRLPVKVLGHKPEPGQAWTVTFCRNIFVTTSGGDKFTCWAPLQARYLEPQNFARLVFKAETLTPDAARQIEADLNRGYRRHLASELTRTMDEMKRLAEVIEKAATDKQFQVEAVSLQSLSSAVQQLVGQADTASFTELRKALRESRTFRKRSYELKYAYLFKELFEKEE